MYTKIYLSATGQMKPKATALGDWRLAMLLPGEIFTQGAKYSRACISTVVLKSKRQVLKFSKNI